MPTVSELEARIRQLEAENSELRDKLDMIYAIVAPEEEDLDEEGPSDGLVQIDRTN